MSSRAPLSDVSARPDRLARSLLGVGSVASVALAIILACEPKVVVHVAELDGLDANLRAVLFVQPPKKLDKVSVSKGLTWFVGSTALEISST